MIILYLVLWAAIGLACGVLAHWLADARLWPDFAADVTVGFLGGVLGGAYLTQALGGRAAVCTAFSLLFALAGALICLAVLHIARRFR